MIPAMVYHCTSHSHDCTTVSVLQSFTRLLHECFCSASVWRAHDSDTMSNTWCFSLVHRSHDFCTGVIVLWH